MFKKEQRTEEIEISGRNQTVYTFIKEPEKKLEPQMQIVFDAIKARGEIFRHQLLVDVAPFLDTKRSISQVVTWTTRWLRLMKLIKTQKWKDYQTALENLEHGSPDKVIFTPEDSEQSDCTGVIPPPDGPCFY